MNNTTVAKIVLTAAIGLGVVGFFFHSSSSHTSAYKMADEVAAAADQWVGQQMKVHGWVQAGTIDEQVVGQEMHRTFVLEHKGRSVIIKHTGPKPDTFRDKAEVVAEGKLMVEDGHAVLYATNLMAKCPSKYDGAQRDKMFQ
ncbi:MAG: cytochrome c maturation protein CcmE [Myxococcales bacterium]|nr:cytochrome c maturation protein CcmE [Myxococcales bacterium]